MQRDERLACRRHDAVAQCLEVALQIREWRAELVRRVRDELAAKALLFFDRRGHLIEGVGERDELLGSFAWGASGVITIGDPTGGAPDLPEGPRDAPSDHHRERSARRCRDDGRDDEHTRDGLVEHLAGTGNALAVLDHHPLEGRAANDEDADRDDRDRTAGDQDRRERDASCDPSQVSSGGVR